MLTAINKFKNLWLNCLMKSKQEITWFSLPNIDLKDFFLDKIAFFCLWCKAGSRIKSRVSFAKKKNVIILRRYKVFGANLNRTSIYNIEQICMNFKQHLQKIKFSVLLIITIKSVFVHLLPIQYWHSWPDQKIYQFSLKHIFTYY